MNGAAAWGVAVALVALAAVAVAQGEVFRYVDRQGVFHFTDRLGDVPEPYYSYYRAMLREREAKRLLQQQQGTGDDSAPEPAVSPRQAAPGPSYQRPVAPSVVDQEEQKRLQWRALVGRWREELAAAMAALDSIRTAKEQRALNPVLAQTPGIQAELAELEVKEAEALARLETARKALAEDLPLRAKRENVSPKWLE